jgi:eukaryotic-like serine/threonine-protein kinase
MDERSIFERALDLSEPQQRAEFLESACGNDERLRSRVGALLRSHEDGGSFLQGIAAGPVVATVDMPAPTELAGTQIGPYKLLQQIGEGGFGVVYMAEQTKPVRRKVALKIIKPGMDTREVIARFEAERQALALMDHPNIAKVLDAGTTGSPGRPYFVMELVRGVPITEFCDAQKLSTRDRLRLFVDICRAVQHAHQKGIIHRDLKPTNVMVTMRDDKPIPKVIDFGISKALSQQLTEKTLFTAYGQMLGTPLYMSPEQAQMNDIDVDTRSDVYSLGVLLYELLTGTTPFDKETLQKSGFDEMRRIIREVDPPRPSARISTLRAEMLSTLSDKRKIDPRKLGASLRGELDWIVMKALEKDRNRRYESASAFAADVERYLADEPVQACPPSVWYRFRKFVRRKKGTLAAATVLGLGLLIAVGGIAGSVGWMAREREAQRTRLTGQVEVVLGDVDRLMKKQKWSEALAAAKRAETLMRSGDAEPQVRDDVQQVLRDLEFVQRLEEIRMKTTRLVNSKFDYAGADRAYAAAFREYGIDVQNLPVEQAGRLLSERTRIAVALGEALDDWAYSDATMYATKNSADCVRNCPRRLLAVANIVDPDPLRQRLRNLLRNLRGAKRSQELRDELTRLARDEQLLKQPVVTLNLVQIATRELGMVEQSLSVLRKAHEQFPDDFWVNLNLGARLDDVGQGVEGLRFSAAAAALRPDSSAAIHNVGVALIGLGMFRQAIPCFRKAIKLDPTYSLPYSHMGSLLRKQGKLDEALIYCEKGVELGPKFAYSHNHLGRVLQEMGRIDEAIKCYQTAIGLQPARPESYHNLGWALVQLRKWEEAEAALRKAIRLKPDDPGDQYGLGLVFYRQKRYAEAAAQFRKTIQMKQDYAEAHHGLGAALYQQHKLNEAIASYQKALRLDPKSEHTHKGLAQAFANRGMRFFRQRSWKEAVADITKAVEATPNSAWPRQCLGWVQYCLGDWKASIQSLETSCKLQRGGKGDEGQWIVMALDHWKLAGLAELPPAERARHRTEARRLYEQSNRQRWHARKGRPPRNWITRAIRAFHAEARKLIAMPVKAHKPKLSPKAATSN